MRLGEEILANERKNEAHKNEGIIRKKLIDLAHAYPKEVTRALVATGVKIKEGLPSAVLHAITLKHLAKNSELREAIARMLLEHDNYLSVDGQTWSLIGGALSAVGSVLGGIGRSQSTSPDEQQAILQKQQMEQQLEQEKARRRRTTWVVIGISAVIIIGLFVAFRSKAGAQTAAKVATA